MKTLIFTFILSLMVWSSNFAQTQNISQNKTEQKSSHISISENDSNNNYQFKAKYDKEYDDAVKEVLVNRFGEENIEEKKGWLSWVFSDSSKDEVYSIKLTSGKVRINLDKKLVDAHLKEEIKTTAAEIKELLN